MSWKQVPELLGNLMRVSVLCVQYSQGACQTRNRSFGAVKMWEKKKIISCLHKHQTCSALQLQWPMLRSLVSVGFPSPSLILQHIPRAVRQPGAHVLKQKVLGCHSPPWYTFIHTFLTTGDTPGGWYFISPCCHARLWQGENFSGSPHWVANLYERRN